MAIRDFPDMYALSPRAYILGKSLMAMLQLLLITLICSIVTTPVVLIPQVIVTLVRNNYTN